MDENDLNKGKFTLSDKARLKAKKMEKLEADKVFEEQKNISDQKYSVSINFSENLEKTKEVHVEDLVTYFSYNLSYIEQNNSTHSLFHNFITLFEYLDNQYRINLVDRKNQMGVMERVMDTHSESEYRLGIAFNKNEMVSDAQIVAYSAIINGLGKSLENILQNIFTSTFQEKYSFANNARLLMSSTAVSSFEKVCFLASEFESVLKQFKLFVNDGEINFELLQMTSTPDSIKDIPSLNVDKYIYFNEDNKEFVACLNLFFSNQLLLAYVEPYKARNYSSFFDLLVNEEVDFNNYEDDQKAELKYLIENGFIYLDNNDFIQIDNIPRALILKDLYENEFACFYHYPKALQEEAKQMKTLEMVVFESSLFSKQEQSYFNYYLNKSEFTNGLDMRNSYLHKNQANPEEREKHEYAYFTYLKLLTLVLLKIEDDLLISKVNNK